MNLKKLAVFALLTSIPFVSLVAATTDGELIGKFKSISQEPNGASSFVWTIKQNIYKVENGLRYDQLAVQNFGGDNEPQVFSTDASFIFSPTNQITDAVVGSENGKKVLTFTYTPKEKKIDQRIYLNTGNINLVDRIEFVDTKTSSSYKGDCVVTGAECFFYSSGYANLSSNSPIKYKVFFKDGATGVGMTIKDVVSSYNRLGSKTVSKEFSTFGYTYVDLNAGKTSVVNPALCSNYSENDIFQKISAQAFLLKNAYTENRFRLISNESYKYNQQPGYTDRLFGAVVNFQNQNGMSLTGVVDSALIQKIKNITCGQDQAKYDKKYIVDTRGKDYVTGTNSYPIDTPEQDVTKETASSTKAVEAAKPKFNVTATNTSLASEATQEFVFDVSYPDRNNEIWVVSSYNASNVIVKTERDTLLEANKKIFAGYASKASVFSDKIRIKFFNKSTKTETVKLAFSQNDEVASNAKSVTITLAPAGQNMSNVNIPSISYIETQGYARNTLSAGDVSTIYGTNLGSINAIATVGGADIKPFEGTDTYIKVLLPDVSGTQSGNINVSVKNTVGPSKVSTFNLVRVNNISYIQGEGDKKGEITPGKKATIYGTGINKLRSVVSFASQVNLIKDTVFTDKTITFTVPYDLKPGTDKFAATDKWMTVKVLQPSTSAAPTVTTPVVNAPVTTPVAPVATTPVVAIPVVTTPVPTTPTVTAPVVTTPVVTTPTVTAPTVPTTVTKCYGRFTTKTAWYELPCSGVLYKSITNSDLKKEEISSGSPISSVMESICTPLSKNLSVKSTGSEVSALQGFLKMRGFLSVDPTGNFGSMTKAAVIKYQLVNNIVPAEGYVGAVTRESIKNNSCGVI